MELLPYEGNGGGAAQLVGDLLGLENRELRHLSRLAEDPLLLSHGPRPRNYPTGAQNQV